MDPNKVWAHFEDATRFALLEELDATPKPGLVDRAGSGSHADMDHALFVASVEAIAPHIAGMGSTGFAWEGEGPELFAAVQAIGQRAEGAMFLATGGVNTHKGAIFTLGVLAAAAGLMLREGRALRAEDVLERGAEVCGPAMREAFRTMDRKRDLLGLGAQVELTHGERAWCAHGLGGVRGEALAGFPTLAGLLPPMRAGWGTADFNAVKLDVLLAAMAELDDTNVVARGGIGALAELKAAAREALESGGARGPGGLARMAALDSWCTARNLSPGGSADLLAAALFLVHLEKL